MSLSENQAVLLRITDLSCVLIGGNLMNMTAQESVFIKVNARPLSDCLLV